MCKNIKMNIKLVDFIDLTDIEREMVLEWRNSNDIRKWMYNNNIISKKEHFRFIEKLKNCNKNKYFLVKSNDINIGVIYFNNININEQCYFGLYGNPFINRIRSWKDFRKEVYRVCF